MKIVSLDEFLKLAAGTIYSEYVPCVCSGLHRKGDTVKSDSGPDCDFFEASVTAECWNGDHPEVRNIEGRWGLFDDHAQFAVYEQEDILKMTEMLGVTP